jgi:5'-nucleotidase
MMKRLFASLALMAVATTAFAGLHSGTVDVRILAINDFHGHIVQDRFITKQGEKIPVGGAAWLTSRFRKIESQPPLALIVSAGDSVGGSPPVSALFQDEPTVEFMNMAGFDAATLGNHELDEGYLEMLRLWKGGKHKSSRYYPKPFPGAKFPIVCANVVEERTGKPILAPYSIHWINGVRIGIIGVVTREAKTAVAAEGLKGLTIADEAEAINKWADHLGKYGVHAIIALVHEGGEQKPENPTGVISGPIADMARRMRPDVDLIISGHTHTNINGFIGRTLITQARNYGAAFADIVMTIDRGSGDVIKKNALILDATHDDLIPAFDVERMVANYEALAAPRVNKVIATLKRGYKRNDGKDALGAVIADAQREAMKADVAFMNSGGIRSDIPEGVLTWGHLYTCQPFGNKLKAIQMTGAQVRKVLEQQWRTGADGREESWMLWVSGITYTWDPKALPGSRVREVKMADGSPLEDAKTYTVAANEFIAGGGDGFTTLADGKVIATGGTDLDALIDYFSAHPDPPDASGRSRRL